MKCDFCPMKCDFCSSYVPLGEGHRVHAPAMAVITKDLSSGWFSPDDWLACDTCYPLICRRDFEPIIAGIISDCDFDPAFVASMHDLLLSIYSHLEVIQ